MGIRTVIAATLAAAAPAMAAPRPPTLDHFDRAVAAYVELHREVEKLVPPQTVTWDPHVLLSAVDRLALEMAAARSASAQGDIFDGDAARILRARLAEALTVNQHRVEDVLASMEQESNPVPRPRVNGRFPPGLWAMTWPCLIDALPVVPPELQYRFVGRDLLLIDVHANLIVDILPDALPAPAKARSTR
jgi:hypothetical protein